MVDKGLLKISCSYYQITVAKRLKANMIFDILHLPIYFITNYIIFFFYQNVISPSLKHYFC